MTTDTDAFVPRQFGQAWSVDDLRDLLENERPATAHTHPALSRFMEAVGGHILWMAKARGLTPMAHTEHRRILWADLWNAAARGQPPESDYYAESVQRQARELGSVFGGTIFYTREVSRREDLGLSLEQVHAAVVETIEKGNFHPYACGELYSFENGVGYKLQMDGWKPQALTWSSEAKFQPLTGSAQPARLEHVTLPVPSGELWVADWIRIPEFTDLSKTWEGTADINSSAGRVAVTAAYAEHGLASVYVGNSSPHILRQGDRLVLGHEHEDEGGKIQVPEGEWLPKAICTDVRWVTLIDRAVLTDRLAEVMPREEAEAKVADYARNTDPMCQFQRIQVKPGTYHLYFAEHPSVFQDKMPPEALPLQGVTPDFVLAPEPLLLDLEAPAPKEKARRPRAAR